MFSIWYQYKESEPEVIDTAETMDEAEYLIDEYTLAYATNIGDISLWITKDGEQ